MSLHASAQSLPLWISADEEQRNRDYGRPRIAEILPASTTLAADFQRFDEEHPQVFRALANRAEEMRSQGVKRITIAKLFEDVRAELSKNGKQYLMNNNNRAFYARKLIAADERLAALIHLRTQTHAIKKESAGT